MNITKLSKEDYTGLKDLSQEEILEKMRKAEIEVPTKGEGRDEFLRFIAMSKEDRDKFLAGDQASPPAGGEGEASSASTESGSSAGQQGAGDTGNAEPSGSGSTDWWKELGYESAEKAMEAHKNLLDLSTKQQATIDSINAREGKRGQELKQLREEKETLSKELNELKLKTTPKVEKPVKPKRPDPKEFESGVYDEEYIAAMEEYHTLNERYTDQLLEFERFERKQELEKLKSELTPKITETPVTEEPQGQTTAWDKLFNEDIPAFQKRFNVVTTVPIKAISDNYALLNTSKDIAAKARARAFLQSVPEADMKIYERVKTAIEVAYDFTSGEPKARYKTIEGALVDNEMLGEGKLFHTVKPASLTPAEEKQVRETQQKKNEQAVSSIPAERLSNQDGLPTGNQTDEEKRKRLRDLTTKYNTAMNAGKAAQEQFEGSTDYQEWIKLRVEVFGRLPQSLRK